MTASRVYRISRFDQIQALAAPARQEIIDALISSGPASATDIAAALGRAADSLYYHIRKLEKVGLVVVVETRRCGRRDEAVYDVPGRPMRIDYDLSDRRVAAAVVDIMGAMLRITQRDFSEAVAEGTAKIGGPHRNLWGGRVKGWISKAGLREINRHLRRVSEIVLSPDREAEGGLHSLTFVLTPLEPKLRKRGGRG